MKLQPLLQPKSIVVIGASREKQKLGRMILDNIVKSGFKGDLYPVNPKSKKIAGLKCFPKVSDVPGDVDLTLIAIPAQFVLDVVKDCAKKEVGAVIIISSGFSETGKDGLELELSIKRVLDKKKIPLLGPNCLGIIHPKAKLNATFAKPLVKEGNIAFLSQSGALGTAALDWAQKVGIGFSHFISIGNKLDLSENDFLEQMNKDPSVKVIGMYLEDFKDGREFMRLSRLSSKPIVVLKPGISKAAQTALGSHTGSLAQNDLIISSALKQSRVIRAKTIEELFYSLMFFSWYPGSIQGRVALITNAGGPGVITTDEIELRGLKLAKLSQKTKKKLALNLPAAANCNNPIDVLGDALADRYEFSLKTALSDKNVDIGFVILTPQTMTEVEGTARVIADIAAKSTKCVIGCFIGGKDVEKGQFILSKAGIPNLNFPSDVVKATSNSYSYTQMKTKRSFKKGIKKGVRSKKLEELIKQESGFVDAQLAERILKMYKIPVLRSHFPKDIADLRRGAEKVGYPVVLKLIHPKIIHKTDVKAVKLGIRNKNELVTAYNKLILLSQKLKLERYKIEMQSLVTGALELILGVKYDEDTVIETDTKRFVKNKGFGHTLLFGMGGIYTEIFKDVSLKVMPLDESDITNMLETTHAGKILKGERGVQYNIKKISNVIQKINQLVYDIPQLKELDINPLFVKGKHVWVVDVKMFIS
jgi:acetyl coenzyme A synthetase (ADP forming)-like protein